MRLYNIIRKEQAKSGVFGHKYAKTPQTTDENLWFLQISIH